MTLRGLLTAAVASLSTAVALAQPSVTVDTLRGQIFGVGEGFGSAVAAGVRKLPVSASDSRQSVVVFKGVKVTVLRSSTQVIPLQVEAPSPEAVRVVSKLLSEMPRAGLVANFGSPESELVEAVTFRGPAEVCAEYLDLTFRKNAVVSAKWRFCVD
jgi:hypothetical protein